MILDSQELRGEFDALVSFFDLSRYFRFASRQSDRQQFEILSDYYEFVGEIVARSGGTIIKFMGDSGLIIYPQSKAEDGILAMLKLKEEGDIWLRERGAKCQHIIKVHFGSIICDLIGTKDDKRLDVIGQTVNIAATLNSKGLAISPQAFRQLSPKGRKMFKKHTEPITYIPQQQPHI